MTSIALQCRFNPSTKSKGELLIAVSISYEHEASTHIAAAMLPMSNVGIDRPVTL